VDFAIESAREALRRTPEVLRSLLAGLPEEWTHAREDADAWSPYQVCGHMLHVEECDWIDRTRVILEHGTDRVFDPVDREAGFARFQGWSLADLLDRFATARAASLEELATLVGPEDLGRRGRHPDFGEVTLAQLLSTWVTHDFNHLNQIVKTMAKEYTDAVGPWRAYLPVLDAP
jgi:uncharacterized damage-inducible protein DinB